MIIKRTNIIKKDKISMQNVAYGNNGEIAAGEIGGIVRDEIGEKE